jgi:hypothetical protein
VECEWSEPFYINLTGYNIEILGVRGGFTVKILLANTGNSTASFIPWEVTLKCFWLESSFTRSGVINLEANYG